MKALIGLMGVLLCCPIISNENKIGIYDSVSGRLHAMGLHYQCERALAGVSCACIHNHSALADAKTVISVWPSTADRKAPTPVRTQAVYPDDEDDALLDTSNSVVKLWDVQQSRGYRFIAMLVSMLNVLGKEKI